MASTRRHQPHPVAIFQDPPPPIPPSPTLISNSVSFDDTAAFAMSSFSSVASATTRPGNAMPRLQPSPMPLQPLQNSASSHDLVLNPPTVAPTRPSPLKPRQSAASSVVAQHHLAHVPIPPPHHQQVEYPAHSPLKKAFFAVGLGHQMQMHVPHQVLFTQFQTMPAQPRASVTRSATVSSMSPPDVLLLDQENIDASTYSDNFADFPDPAYPSRAPTLKRSLMDAAPPKDRSHKKSRQSEASAVILPSPKDMPIIEDDGAKPQYSYATLIGMSILRAPGRRLTLAQIYKWIQDSFAYYRRSDAGWQNSIRHNLSLNKAFIKQERPKDDPGKGHYWAIQPGMEHQFMKEKSVRRSTISAIPLSASSPSLSIVQPNFRPASHQPVAANPPMHRALMESTMSLPSAPLSSLQQQQIRHQHHRRQASLSSSRDLATPLPVEAEPSSDATLPASDPALHEHDEHDFFVPEEIMKAPHSSPPPPTIHSSPPVASTSASQVRGQQGTPTPRRHSRVPSSGSHMRRSRAPAGNDSGYFSSLESSILKPRPSGHILTSEIDIEQPRIKRGRAEEEIARLRSSSHDISPIRQSAVDSTSFFVTSSPSHPINPRSVDPLTPAVKFKKPAKPPKSVSPMTNLRNHRKKIHQMLFSPIKGMGLAGTDVPWSPNFRIQEDSTPYPDPFRIQFDMFADSAPLSAAATGSPEKRSAKRPRCDRTVSANVLGESVNLKNKLNTPLSKGPKFKPSDKTIKSPSQSPDYKRFLHLPQDDQDFFDSFDLFTNESDENINFEDIAGVDILQGFPSIDVSKENHSPRKALGNRPGMGSRSFTTGF